MHETLIAEGILEIVRDERAKKIRIIIGELQGIDKEILEEYLRKNTDCKFEIVEEKTLLKCNRCGFEWHPKKTGKEIEDIHFLPEVVCIFEKCPNCGSRDIKIEKGRGIWLEILEKK